jgi:hypothetical protein
VYGVNRVQLVTRLHSCYVQFHVSGQSANLEHGALIPGNNRDCGVMLYNGLVSIKFTLHEVTWTSHAITRQDSWASVL